jgi:hypothetical protein
MNLTDRLCPARNRRSRTVELAAVCAVAISVLSGCGGGSADGGKPGADVASISGPSASAESAKPSAASDSGRPQLRLDSSKEEERRLNNAWASCLKDHGVKTYTKNTPDGDWTFPDMDVSDIPASAKVCASKQPLQPAETDPKRNPHYADDFHDWIKCMNSKGLKVVALPDNEGWNYASNTLPSNSDEIENDCRLKAFGAKK